MSFKFSLLPAALAVFTLAPVAAVADDDDRGRRYRWEDRNPDWRYRSQSEKEWRKERKEWEKDRRKALQAQEKARRRDARNYRKQGTYRDYEYRRYDRLPYWWR